MRVAVVSANLGGYDPHVAWKAQVVPPGVTVDIHRLTDANFPPRSKAMTSSLQCGIAKMFGWQLFPGYDAYIWIDASRGLLREDTVAWFLGHLDGKDLVLFRHPERRTIREEYDFVKAKLDKGSRYLTKRYAGEWLDAQYAAITIDAGYRDLTLYASTAFAYRPTASVRQMLRDWWYHKSRFLLHDQLALPYVVARNVPYGRLAELNDSVYDCVHLPITRTAKR